MSEVADEKYDEIKRSAKKHERALSTSDRITGQIVLSHESYGNQPITFNSKFTKPLEFKEEPYQRRPVIGEDWVNLLDGCWVKHPGTVGIENRAGHGIITQQTAEERDAVAKQILLVCPKPVGVEPFRSLVIRPGQARAVDLDEGVELWVRSASGEIPLTLVVFPR